MSTEIHVRRGLPRVVGGKPWPPVVGAVASPTPIASPTVAEPQAVAGTEAASSSSPDLTTTQPASVATVSVGAPSGSVRRGLPRVPGGEPWPPTVAAPLATPVAASSPALATAPAPAPEPTPPPVSSQPESPQPETKSPAPAPPAPQPVQSQPVVSQPAVSKPDVSQAAKSAPTAAKNAQGSKLSQLYKPWMGKLAVAIIATEIVLLAVVLLARALLSLEAVQDFVQTYPGHAPMPASAPIGVPVWLAWQHFFNAFLMVLIIRSGLTVRHETKPQAFWTSKRKSSKKVSLTVWFHQSLDLLWVINGVIFVVLLIVTGHWMRIVPTSVEIVPNAISAALQYASLNWPTENGWIHYNALQQIAYFLTVFIAAPLAMISGFRMSSLWPESNKKLSQAYPIELARTLHFPVMLYFVAFIAVHVFLVFTTGALRNLNHMFAAQGSEDPAAYAGDWTGFVIFMVSLVVTVIAWFAARPMVLAPIATLFGKVSSR